MSRVKYENFEKGETREQKAFEVKLGKIILVEDITLGGYTAFFKPDYGIISQGETKETAIINLLDTFNTTLITDNIKLNIKKILPK
jgi:predicted RNase H-like HicB family nuclease